MKVVHINTNRGGGAALCAMRICDALSKYDIETSFLVPDGLPTDKYSTIPKDVSIWDKYYLLRRFRNFCIKRNLWRGELQLLWELEIAEKESNLHPFTHIPLSSYKDLPNHPLVKNADIIHLHWVSGFIDYPTFFSKIKKPIIWTLHDKYPAVGLQHYSSEFFPLPPSMTTLEKKCQNIKKKALLNKKNIQLVAISKEMNSVCSNSDILKGLPITVIHNGVDGTIFKPYNKIEARKEISPPQIVSDKSNIFVYCECVIWSYNKGLDRVVEAIEKSNIPEKILICVGKIGNSNIEFNTSFPIIQMGNIVDQKKIAKVFSAADFFIQASYEESFGQTLTEAMSCGTPVISTPCGIAPEIINEHNGVLCKGFSTNDLYEGIQQAFAKKHSFNTPKEIHDYITKDYSFEIIAQKYLNLYHKVIIK